MASPSEGIGGRMTLMNRVLIVDDEEHMRAAVKAVLEQAGGFETDHADSAEAALARIVRERYDLVFVDKNLPGQNGVELIRWIRQSNQEMPIVMMTAYPSPESVKETINLGIDAYLEKPFPDIFDVVDVARQAIARRRAGFAAPPPSTTRRAGEQKVLIAAASDEAKRSLSEPFSDGGAKLSWAATAEAVRSGAREVALVVFDAASFRAELADILDRVRADAPHTAIVVVSTESLTVPILRHLVQLRIRGLFDPGSYPSGVKDVLGALA